MNKSYLSRIFIASVFFIINNTLIAQDSLQISDTNQITVIFAGDIMGHDAQIEGAYNEQSKKYDYEPTFRYIKEYIQNAGIAVGNLEVTLAGPPFKGYPQFSSPDELLFYAQSAGFDVLLTANNHALDRGDKGFIRTLDMLDSLGLYRAGTYRDSIERMKSYPLIIERNNILIALLNYTYGTNGLNIQPPLIINRIDTAQIDVDIEKAKLIDPDFIIACMHWGIEYERIENESQKELAEFLIEKGVDIIIGSHPHVVQPVRYLTNDSDTTSGYPVFYSLGNFVSNQRAQYKDGGIIAEIKLTKIADSTSVSQIAYLPYWVWREERSKEKFNFYVLPVSLYETQADSINLSPGDEYRLNRFSADTRKHLEDIKESDFYK
ncbi:MAG: CapA family protein [Bacteroidales bacterium]|nr:CapA family protein [Bacteroidales bacterium]